MPLPRPRLPHGGYGLNLSPGGKGPGACPGLGYTAVYPGPAVFGFHQCHFDITVF